VLTNTYDAGLYSPDPPYTTARATYEAISSVFIPAMDGLYQLTVESQGPNGVLLLDLETGDSATSFETLAAPFSFGSNTVVARLQAGSKVLLFATTAGTVTLSGARLADEVPPEE